MPEHVDSSEFLRTYGLRSKQIAWFVGAGASAAAGVATGGDMIRDFHARLFCADVKVPRREIDPTDPIWMERIALHLASNATLPPPGSPTEYAAAFKAVYPSERDRRAYIDTAVRDATPSFGHRVLAALIASSHLPCLFTTNFDQLIERASVVASELDVTPPPARLVIAALDGVERAQRCLRDSSWPLLVKLHGDYTSDHLKNTSDELQAQDAVLRSVLVETLGRFGLLVAGYSGRDDSIMDALEDVLDRPNPFPAGLWWIVRSADAPLPRVTELLDKAHQAGVDGGFVIAETFDELAGDIEREIELPEPLRDHVDGFRPQRIVEDVSLPDQYGARFPAVRCSALEVLELPRHARNIELARPLSTADVRRLIRDSEIWATAAARGRDVSFFGSDEEIMAAFAEFEPKLAGTTTLDPESNSVDLGLVYEALARALTRRRPLRAKLGRRGHTIVVAPPKPDRSDMVARTQRTELASLQGAYDAALTGTVPQINRPFAEAVRLSLEFRGDRWWCVYEPFTWVDLGDRRGDVDDARRDDAAESLHREVVAVAGDWRRERWANRYNKRWDQIIAGWSKLLVGQPTLEVDAHWFDGPGVNATFQLSWMTAWTRPADAGRG